MGPGMMNPWLMGGWAMGAWALGALLLIALVVVLAVWLGRSGGSRGAAAPGPSVTDSALAELRRRYATGEISREEYFQRKTDLEQ
ncbi:SHOCT domain-containing protein [Nocardiopsis sp. EMB25]|nr:SHOCT domain-containing protein [Nocardiopsis sp. EMB25]